MKHPTHLGQSIRIEALDPKWLRRLASRGPRDRTGEARESDEQVVRKHADPEEDPIRGRVVATGDGLLLRLLLQPTDEAL